MDYLVRKPQDRTWLPLSSGMSAGQGFGTVWQIHQGNYRRDGQDSFCSPPIRAATLELHLEATSLKDAHCDLEDRFVSRQINQAMELAAEKKEMLVVCEVA
jgi:hypothetical protein